MSTPWHLRVVDGWWTGRVDQRSGLTAEFCASQHHDRATHVLVPVRVYRSDHRDVDGPAESGPRSLRGQAESLGDKLAGIARLGLSPIDFATRVSPGRLYVEHDPSVSEQELWAFAKEGIDGLREATGLEIVSQIDYDQKRFHEGAGSVLESVEFAVRHDPSAIATTESYLSLLEHLGVPASAARVAVTGTGDLGSRIVERLDARGVEAVFISDWSQERMDALQQRLPSVQLSDPTQISTLPCHAQILSADKSLTPQIAEQWAAQDTLLVVGGPEAGIDRFSAELEMLEAAGKSVVPSILCGTLGLVSNLEESLGHVPDLLELERRQSDLVADLLADTDDSGVTFRQACLSRVTGQRPAVTAG